MLHEPFEENHLVLIVDLYNQPELIAANIEDRVYSTPDSDAIGIWIDLSNILQAAPFPFSMQLFLMNQLQLLRPDACSLSMPPQSRDRRRKILMRHPENQRRCTKNLFAVFEFPWMYHALPVDVSLGADRSCVTAQREVGASGSEV